MASFGIYIYINCQTLEDLIYLITFLRKKKYFSYKMGKIGSWRSLRIVSAKLDFCRFMYCFGRFSALTQNLWAILGKQVHYIF
jgi:hypothetical protein